MTKLRSKIVSRQSLNAIARQIGLDRLVILNGNGTALAQKHIYGDAFEAMMGAIYLDQGYNFVNRLLINRLYRDHLSLEELTESETDFKSRLIEWSQKNHHTIRFRTLRNESSAANRPVIDAGAIADVVAKLTGIPVQQIESSETQKLLHLEDELKRVVIGQDEAVATAVAGELLGLRLLYLEAGSGALLTVPAEMVRRVRQAVSVPLIAGGGIRTVEQMYSLLDAGADMVVVGNHLEERPDEMEAFCRAAHACGFAQ